MQALAARGITLVRLIAGGGMSEVYEGLRGDQRVAVKLLHATSQVSRNFVQALVHEAELMQRLQHPNLLEVLDAGQVSEEAYFIVMPYASGGTLRQRLAQLRARGKFMSEREALQIAHQVAKALEYVHAQGIVHRDIKPSNILFTDTNASAKLADFGVATELEEALRSNARALVLGTPEYASPEQARGHADVRADLYALGIVLYEMLSGAPPFQGKTPNETLSLHATAPLPSLPRSVSPQTLNVLLKATAKNPLHRFQSAREMRQAIEKALAHLPIEQVRRVFSQALRLVLFAASLIAVALVGLLLILVLAVNVLASRLEAHLSADRTWSFPPLGVENRLSQVDAQRIVNQLLGEITPGIVSVSHVALGPANNRVAVGLNIMSVIHVEVAFWLTSMDGIPKVEVASLSPALLLWPVDNVLEGAINRGVLTAWQRHGYRLTSLVISPSGEMIYTLAGPLSSAAQDSQSALDDVLPEQGISP